MCVAQLHIQDFARAKRTRKYIKILKRSLQRSKQTFAKYLRNIQMYKKKKIERCVFYQKKKINNVKTHRQNIFHLPTYCQSVFKKSALIQNI